MALPTTPLTLYPLPLLLLDILSLTSTAILHCYPHTLGIGWPMQLETDGPNWLLNTTLARLDNTFTSVTWRASQNTWDFLPTNSLSAPSQPPVLVFTPVVLQLSALKAWHIAHNLAWNRSSHLCYVLDGVHNLTPWGSKHPLRPPVTTSCYRQDDHPVNPTPRLQFTFRHCYHGLLGPMSTWWTPSFFTPCFFINSFSTSLQEVCKTQEKYTRSFLDVVRLKKLKSEEIFEIRPVVMELP